jgi:hypothetical protein
MKLTAFVLALGVSSPVAADPLLSEDTWKYERPWCPLLVDGGLSVGIPAALPTGLARGLGLGFSRGQRFAWGVRGSWMAATESAPAWRVSHDEFRVRAIGAIRHDVGRGTFGLRVGLGGTLVREHRVRHQGMRAGLEGDDLETTAVALLPMATIEGVLALHVRGRWSLVMSGGPTIVYDDDARGGFAAEIGVAWQP